MANEFGQDIDRIPSVEGAELFFAMVDRRTANHTTTLRLHKDNNPKLHGVSLGIAVATFNPYVLASHPQLLKAMLAKLNKDE